MGQMRNARLGWRPAVPTYIEENDQPSGPLLGAVTMRRWIAVASLAATLALLIPTPVLARTTMHGGGHVVSHPHRAAVVGNRFVFISRTGFDNHFLFFDRVSGRFITVPRHRFAGFGRFEQFSPFSPFNRFSGFNGFGDFGGFGWDGVPWGWNSGPGAWVNYGSDLAAEPPAGEFGALPLPPPRSAAELPRCHEATSVGVVIERGAGCAH